MATIRDVARASKVSIATVSRVFNHSDAVSDDTRARVMAAASRLGYWPNGIARSLITNRTHTLGVLLPDLHGEFFSEVIHGVDLAARARGFHILVSRASSRADELTSALRSMRGRVDGLVVMAPDLGASAALQQSASSIRTVLINPDRRFVGCDTVAVANVEGARAIVRHLVAVGHRRIATVAGPEHNVDARQRLEGYRTALREAGLDPDATLEFRGDFTELSGYEAGLDVLGIRPLPTAIFVANDYMAVGVLGALQDRGVEVPSAMAVVGFDDIPLARYLNPPLTTVHVDMLRLGERAVEMLLDTARTAGPGHERHEVLATDLVVRRSCGVPVSGPDAAVARGHAAGNGRPTRR